MIPDTNDIHDWIIYDYSSGSNLTYLWDFGDGSTSSLVSPTHTYAATGKYQVCLTVSNGSCSSTKCDTAYADSAQLGQGMRRIQVVNMHVGVNEYAARNFGIEVYPSPSSSPVTFSCDAEIDELKIYSAIGEVVYASTPKQKSVALDAIGKPGIYVASVRSGGVTKTIRFIIQ
jgi:PKD repeat protein